MDLILVYSIFKSYFDIYTNRLCYIVICYIYIRSYSWFWGWGKPREDNLPDDSDSACSTDVLKKQLHDARLKVAKIEAKLSGTENTTNFVDDEDCYSLLFKVNQSFVCYICKTKAKLPWE